MRRAARDNSAPKNVITRMRKNYAMCNSVTFPCSEVPDWVVCGYVAAGKCIQRDDVSGFSASAFFPEGHTSESVLMWRKKFRQNRIELIANASPNLTNGPYREYNVPLQPLLAHKMTAWCMGDRRKVYALARRIKFLGKKRSMGVGRVCGVEVTCTAGEDFSLVGPQGLAMRWLPIEGGPRLVRSRPPYWNNTDRVPHCEVGDPYDPTQLCV
jgi:hypothetical protein